MPTVPESWSGVVDVLLGMRRLPVQLPARRGSSRPGVGVAAMPWGCPTAARRLVSNEWLGIGGERLAERRFGGDPRFGGRFWPSWPVCVIGRRMRRACRLATICLMRAAEGLFGFGALARGVQRVTFSDISRDRLWSCREAARELGVSDRCVFVERCQRTTSGHRVSVCRCGHHAVSADLCKGQADCIHRVRSRLRPGGRISIFEPINQFAELGGSAFLGYDLSLFFLPGRQAVLRRSMG